MLIDKSNHRSFKFISARRSAENQKDVLQKEDVKQLNDISRVIN